MNSKITAAAISALIVAASAGAALPSAPADTYPKNFDIDVLHYVFNLALSDATDRIDGIATVQIRFLVDGVESFELDLVGRASRAAETGMMVGAVDELAAESGAAGGGVDVAEEPFPPGTRLPFSHVDDRLSIELVTPSRGGEVRRFRIVYSGTPATGLIIGDNKHGDRTFFSDNWPDKARHWLPTIDHPYEKATSEMVVMAPMHYQVISNGLLVEQTDLHGEALAGSAAGGTLRRTHWKQSVPIAPWLFALGVAPFAVDYYDDFEGKSLETWVYAQDRDAGFYDFAVPTKDVMRFYSDAIGPYSYEKLANVQSNSVGGGMEAATAIFYGDDSVTGDRSVRWRNVIIHEIAHQWWGNAVTENDWDHVWLSEGFATYFTLLYREYAYGRDDFLQGLSEARQRIVDFYAETPGYRVVHENLDDMGRVSNGMTYQKGAWFLHMLRGLVGEDRFWQGIREYYRLYRDGNASTDDFREVMENTYEPAIDLSSFFEQWLYQGGFPHLEGDWAWDAENGELVIELTQIDDDGYMFEMPIPVEITMPPPAGGRGGRGGAPRTVTERAMIGSGTLQTRIALEGEPIDVAFDPDHWVLMELQVSRR